MKLHIIEKPCYYAESIYLLYAYVNQLSFEEEYRRVQQSYCVSGEEKENTALLRVRELQRVAQEVTADLDPDQERLQYFFKALPGTDSKSNCCLAQVMLMSIPLNHSEIDDFAEALYQAFLSMEKQGMELNDISPMGLVMERWDSEEPLEPLATRLERLPCSMEGKWMLMRLLTSFREHLNELTELIRPVAEKLHGAMDRLNAMNQEVYDRWNRYFEHHSVDDFFAEMFETTALYTGSSQKDEVWLSLWNFNSLGAWSESYENEENNAHVLYLGSNISFEFAKNKRNRPDAETLCNMLRPMTGKDKLEILHRCALCPTSAAQLSSAMNLNSGTVSRNLYGLFKLGYLETRDDGERVNYVTKLEALDQVFRWVMEYVSSRE